MKPAAAKAAAPRARPLKTTGPAETAASGAKQPVTRGVEGRAKRKWSRRAPKTPAAETPAPEKNEVTAPEAPAPAPEKIPEPKREPLDYLQDGAVEWGIKRPKS